MDLIHVYITTLGILYRGVLGEVPYSAMIMLYSNRDDGEAYILIAQYFDPYQNSVMVLPDGPMLHHHNTIIQWSML